jgi:bacterioferritin-associated ferredoxin
MIVCSCNVLSDQDVRSVVEAQARRSTSQVYGCLACSAKCGRCARTIHSLMDEALGKSRSSIGANRLSAQRDALATTTRTTAAIPTMRSRQPKPWFSRL